MSKGCRIVHRHKYSIGCEAYLDTHFPENKTIRYNGGERADYNPCPGVVYSRIVFHAGNDWAGDHYSAEVWG